MFEIWLMIMSSIIRTLLLAVLVGGVLIIGVYLHDLWKERNNG